MTQIVNLPALTTITNALVFPAADTSDGNRTKKVSLSQLVALSAGPRGPAGVAGVAGPRGPSGPSGPFANQGLNTNNAVTFDSVSVTNPTYGIVFGDNSVQSTAYKRGTRVLTEFSVGNASLTATEIDMPILSGNPPVSGRNLYLPIAGTASNGKILIIRNNSNDYTFNVWGGASNLATVPTNGAVQVACDGFTWFVI